MRLEPRDKPSVLLTLAYPALVYAHEVHGDHTRKGNGVPYIGHLMGVASIVIDDGGTEDEAIAALLHDAPEDRGGRARLDDIRARFGDAVAKIVEDCTASWIRVSVEDRIRVGIILRHYWPTITLFPSIEVGILI